MNVHFIIHESFEAPAAYETWASTRGHRVSYSRVYAYEPLPAAIEPIDLLVVLGGPQSPSTTKEECPHFDAAAEMALMVQCIAAKKAVVGVCLGAQLMGEALGARCERSPEKEIGNFPITLTVDGKNHPLLSHFGDTLETGHWHNDMPGLTREARVLVTSAGCPRQIIEYGKLAYGFQCHMEFNTEVVEQLIAASGASLERLQHHRFVQQADVLRRNNYQAMNETLFGFLDKLMAAYQHEHS